jgi:hypothetical protein
LKRDAPSILRFLDELESSSWLGIQRREWPRYVYHYSDIRNIVEILKCGQLLCRRRVVDDNRLKVDIADKEIIQDSRTHDYARFYFRPRTPTQFDQEGIRPPAIQVHGAHCPVPVFLLFDSRSMLTRDECLFTRGNLKTRGHEPGRSARFLSSIDFHSVYHDGPFSPEERNRVIFSRNAEVLFPDSVDLEELKWIVCRSGAEKQTLLHLLGDDAGEWNELIRLEARSERLFERRWTYVEDVRLLDDLVQVELRNACVCSNYEIRVSNDLGDRLVSRPDDFSAQNGRALIRMSGSPARTWVRVEIENCLAFESYLLRGVLLR